MEQTPLSQQTNCAPAQEQKCPEPVAPPTEGSDSQTPPAKHMTPAEQLDALRHALKAGQREMLRFEPLKTSIADLVPRIQSLETAVAAQSDASAAYTNTLPHRTHIVFLRRDLRQWADYYAHTELKILRQATQATCRSTKKNILPARGAWQDAEDE